MKTSSFLLTAAAALALGAGTARAQQAEMQHGQGMQHGMQHDPAGEIAEGTVKNGVRTVEIAVTEKGFEPSRVKAKKGEKVRLVVTRKTNSTCAKEMIIKDLGINQPLPLDKAVTVELTPKSSGEIHWACAMGHVRGVLFVP